MRRAFTDFAVAHNGSVLVETAIVMPIFLMIVLCSIDFLFAFYQWSAAAKAVQIGLRIAVVSDPVAKGLGGLAAAAVGPNAPPGSPLPVFVVTCDGASETCNCRGSCSGVGGYDVSAMNAIVRGRNSEACGDGAGVYQLGMCDVFRPLTAANVMIEYQGARLGYAGRPGSVPTITLSLHNVPFQFVFLRSLLGTVPIPALTASMTAEDMSSTAD
jgi:TadE-like protein